MQTSTSRQNATGHINCWNEASKAWEKTKLMFVDSYNISQNNTNKALNTRSKPTKKDVRPFGRWSNGGFSQTAQSAACNGASMCVCVYLKFMQRFCNKKCPLKPMIWIMTVPWKKMCAILKVGTIPSKNVSCLNHTPKPTFGFLDSHWYYLCIFWW